MNKQPPPKHSNVKSTVAVPLDIYAVYLKGRIAPDEQPDTTNPEAMLAFSISKLSENHPISRAELETRVRALNTPAVVAPALVNPADPSSQEG
jgi:hypothetical protein